MEDVYLIMQDYDKKHTNFKKQALSNTTLRIQIQSRKHHRHSSYVVASIEMENSLAKFSQEQPVASTRDMNPLRTYVCPFSEGVNA